MVSNMKKTIEEFKKIYLNKDMDLFMKDPHLKADFYYYNLSLTITAAMILCVLFIIVLLIGSFSPFATGFILPGISATAIYLTAFFIDLFFLGLLIHEMNTFDGVATKRTGLILKSFLAINMLIACSTFFTAQKDSGFFFEYILVTLVIYLIPNASIGTYFRNIVINLTTMIILLIITQYPVGWQDAVDLAVMQIICLFVNYTRLLSFIRVEKNKFEMEDENVQLYKDSRLDSLTGLLNRNALRHDFMTFVNAPVGVALIDVDFFKNYNDGHGHDYGDRVLKKMGKEMKAIFNKEKDHCYRYGGDEFLIISEEEDPDLFSSKLFELQDVLDTEKEGFDLSCSIGYSGGIPDSSLGLRKIINQADKHLYKAKHQGKGMIEGSITFVKDNDPVDEKAGEEVAEGLDPLTGLPHMHAFFKLAAEERQKPRDQEKDGELAVLYFDLINFKLFNLSYGITSADQFLRSMGRRLKESFADEVVAHLDGDRFAVLTNTIDLDERVEEARDNIQKAFPDSVECSVGICIWDDHTISTEKICNNARIASDESRKEVGKYISYYSKETGEELETSAYVVSHLEEAIQKDWIVVYYQPVVRSLSNQVCGMEALARWDDPHKGLLQPGAFIPALEDAHLIWKLDLCVIKKVIQQIAQRDRQGIPEIPVSINLSRMDFISCDIINEIETFVKQYDIPRRMLHIEVTESIMTSKENVIFNTLQAFRNAGYEIWMDDFGSGYSTLNLLKDYSFDVLKLDMVFLRHDTSRSRDIIASVIRMDKSIGIRSLAEGVETKEQAEFLKKCGCEKMQGYYFGKPMPFDDMIRTCTEKGLDIESPRQKICYDRLSQVNFMSDIPMAIAEIQVDRIHILFVNDQLKTVMDQDGYEDIHEIEKNINDRNNVASRELLKAGQLSMISKNTGELTTPFKDQPRLLKYRLLGQYDQKALFVINVYQYGGQNEELTPKAQMLLNLSYFYRHIYSLDPSTMMIQSVRFTDESMLSSNASPLIDEQGNVTIILPEIYVADQKRYQDFIDPQTLLRRLERSEFGSIRSVFRTKNFQGRFMWMTHMILLAPNSDEKKILYVMRATDDTHTMSDAPLLTKKTIDGFFKEGDNDARYFEDLIHNCPIPFFWKDEHRRFIGVSQSFLNYWGFHSENELIGKTDEDMNWHPNNESYKQVEEKILKTGKSFRYVPGKCMVKGEARDIYATKWPIYKNGQISGLMGYFIDKDRFKNDTEDMSHGEFSPNMLPGCKDAAHFIDDLISFETDYELNKRKFGVIYVKIPELVRIANNFGRETMYAAVQDCYSVIAKVVDYRATTAYVGIGQFAVATSYTSPQEIIVLADHIREGIDAIRQVNEVPCTLYAKTRILYTKDVMKARNQMSQMLFHEEQMPHAERDLSFDYNTVLESLMEEMPIGCYIIKPDHSVVYWNKEAEKLLGFSASEMQGKKCIDMPLGCSFTSGEHIPRHSCPAMVAFVTGRSQTMQMFMKQKDGKDLLIKNTLVPLKDAKGEITELISLFVPLTEGDYDQNLVSMIYEVSTRDPLTCLPGRKYMEVCLEEAFELYHRINRPFAVLFADVNDFHDINNTYGHGNGDAILRQFGLALRKYGRKTDHFCRWGGDEFVGLLQLKEAEDIKEASRRFMKIAEESYEVVDGNHITCRAAIGITVVREDDTVDSLIARADRYMYEAKKSKTERIVTDYTKQA